MGFTSHLSSLMAHGPMTQTSDLDLCSGAVLERQPLHKAGNAQMEGGTVNASKTLTCRRGGCPGSCTATPPTTGSKRPGPDQ